MPNKVDFSRVTNLKKISINPRGWVNPLFVEYGLDLYFSVPSYLWRVQGTHHTFVIPIARLEFLSSGEYGQHFEMALENFREEYLGWRERGFDLDWMREYQTEYSRFILP